MPWAMRVEYPGAICHVMNRGGRREDSFVDDVDPQDFPKTLAGKLGENQSGALHGE